MIVVDEIQHYPGVKETKGLPSEHWCHLSSSFEGPEGEAELRAFAPKIGLNLAWIQNPGRRHVHFDLTRSKRLQAIKAGAVGIEAMEFARARLSGPAALAAYLLSRTSPPPPARPVFGETPAPAESRGCVNGGGRPVRS